MELVHNKVSGKAFIVIDDNSGIDFLLITPDGKVKRLERRLFNSIPSIQERQSLKMITTLQLNKYREIVGD